MKKKVLFSCLILMSIALFSQEKEKQYTIRTIAFYNLENL